MDLGELCEPSLGSLEPASFMISRSSIPSISPDAYVWMLKPEKSSQVWVCLNSLPGVLEYLVIRKKGLGWMTGSSTTP
jgi:hypothetical protein